MTTDQREAWIVQEGHMYLGPSAGPAASPGYRRRETFRGQTVYDLIRPLAS